MCSVPVTFGGGSWMENEGLPGVQRGAVGARRSPYRRQWASMAAGSRISRRFGHVGSQSAHGDLMRCNPQGRRAGWVVGPAVGCGVSPLRACPLTTRMPASCRAATCAPLLSACGGGNGDHLPSCGVASQRMAARLHRSTGTTGRPVAQPRPKSRLDRWPGVSSKAQAHRLAAPASPPWSSRKTRPATTSSSPTGTLDRLRLSR